MSELFKRGYKQREKVSPKNKIRAERFFCTIMEFLGKIPMKMNEAYNDQLFEQGPMDIICEIALNSTLHENDIQAAKTSVEAVYNIFLLTQDRHVLKVIEITEEIFENAEVRHVVKDLNDVWATISIMMMSIALGNINRFNPNSKKERD